MKAEIDSEGFLIVEAETPIEAFALRTLFGPGTSAEQKADAVLIDYRWPRPAEGETE